MKSQKMLFVLICFFAVSQVCFGQDKKVEIVLINSVVEPECEDLLDRLDTLAVEMQNTPNSIGYVVIYGGLNSIENNFYERYINLYPKLRGLKENRFSTLTTKGKKELKVEFWLSKDGKKPEVLEDKFGYDLPQINKRYFFVEESGEIINFDGERQFVGDCPACCIETFDLNLLSKFLEANPKLNAHVIIYNKTTLSRANKLIKLISDTATIDYKIPHNRLKIIYGGNKEGIYVWNKNMSSLSVWLVPNNIKKTKSQSNKN